jgi:hypothetical protein
MPVPAAQNCSLRCFEPVFQARHFDKKMTESQIRASKRIKDDRVRE